MPVAQRRGIARVAPDRATRIWGHAASVTMINEIKKQPYYYRCHFCSDGYKTVAEVMIGDVLKGHDTSKIFGETYLYIRNITSAHMKTQSFYLDSILGDKIIKCSGVMLFCSIACFEKWLISVV